MNATEFRLRILHAAPHSSDEPFACEEIDVRSPTSHGTGHVDLLVIDARGMPTESLHAALRQCTSWNAAGVFRRGLVIWPNPNLEGVVLAIRAGLHDIVHSGFGALRLARILADVLPSRAQRRIRVRQVMQLLKLGLTNTSGRRQPLDKSHADHLAAEERMLFEQRLAGREASLAQREQELKRTATRVQADLDRANQACAMIELAAEMRSELEKRENELRLMTRQAAQAESAPPRPADNLALRREVESLIQTQQLSLDRRERALATREQWLRDYELALTGRPVASEYN